MADEAPAKAKFGLGHWIALGGAALALVLLLLQLVLVLVRKGLSVGFKLNGVAQTLLLAVFIAGAVVALMMARRNRKMYAMLYVLAAAIFLLVPMSALRVGEVFFYVLVCILVFIVGALISSGALTLPGKSDLQTVADTLHHAEAEAPAKPETKE